jgi:hypothetical protein
MATPIGGLLAAARIAAAEVGELQPVGVRTVAGNLPETIRAAILDDLVSGAYRLAALEVVTGHPDMVQG